MKLFFKSIQDRCKNYKAKRSAVDPWHFGTDPDQRIRDTELRIRILLFREWLTRCQQKISFLCLLLFEGKFTSGLEDEKSKKSHKIVAIMTAPGGSKTYGSYGSGSTTLQKSYKGPTFFAQSTTEKKNERLSFRNVACWSRSSKTVNCKIAVYSTYHERLKKL